MFTLISGDSASGSPCLSPGDLKQTRICNQRPCRTYLWQVSPWSPCVRKTNATAPCGDGTGQQHRTVHCEMDPGQLTFSFFSDVAEFRKYQDHHIINAEIIKWYWIHGAFDIHVILWLEYTHRLKRNSLTLQRCSSHFILERKVLILTIVYVGYPVNETLCHLPNKPAQLQTCSAPCPQDCQISKWSSWSVCSHTCGRHAFKVRTRRVLRLAMYGGTACPPQANKQGEHCTE